MKIRIRTAAMYLLVAIGFLQIIGLAIPGLSKVRGLGMATTASPLPLVFSHFRGLETFSSKFALKVTDINGQVAAFNLDPKTYEKLSGPYNRRNVYGAVVAYGPKLTLENDSKLVQNVLRFGFCKMGPLSQILDVRERIAKVEIHVTNTVTPLDSTLEVGCQ